MQHNPGGTRRHGHWLALGLLWWCVQAPARDLWGDGVDYLTGPAEWGRAEWTRLGGVLALTAVAYQADAGTRAWFADHPSADGERLAALGNSWGELTGLAGLTLLGLYGGGVATENDRWQRLAGNGLEAVVLSGLTTSVGKAALGRVRPSDTIDPGQWLQGGQSFPSGHTTAAFALSTALAEGVDNPGPGRRVIFYSLATATAYARLYDQRHWLSDTVMGAAIGIHAGLYVSRRHAGGRPPTVLVFPLPYGVGFVAGVDL